MSRERPVDVAASVRQRLLNRARDQGQDYQYVLGAFAVERLLYRLSRSAHRDRFVLKGATLFTLWSDLPHRATWDLDLLARAGGSVDDVLGALQDIVRVPVEDDGLVFDAASLEGALIREGRRFRPASRWRSLRCSLGIRHGRFSGGASCVGRGSRRSRAAWRMP